MGVWQSALLAVLGGTLTMLGTWSGARWQAREARAARQEQLAREDRYRLYERRIEGYSAFYHAVSRSRGAFSGHTVDEDTSPAQAADASRSELIRRYITLVLIADDEVKQAASALLGLVTDVAYNGVDPDLDRYDEAIQAFANAARQDLVRTDK